MQIISGFGYLLFGSLICTIVYLGFRNDLIAAIIAKSLRSAPGGHSHEPGQYDWTEAAATLTVDGVPPAVWVQALANQLRKFDTDRLIVVNGHLDTCGKRLADMRNMARWAVVIQK